MVIKGTSCAGARRLAVHLTRTDTNERAEVREITGVAAEDLRGALVEMEAVAAGTRCTKPFYHASINTRADERLTDEQRTHAISRLEEKLGLTGQPRVIVVHEKEGREHCHIVWSRIDLEHMRAISDSHNYRKHEEVARDLEREFGHERVQGAHAERDGKQRPSRTPSHEEMLQAERGAVSPDEAKALVTELWRRADSGKSFQTALENEGWLLARGDRRDFVVIDPHGGTHSLARRVEGVKAKDIRARMADVDPEMLPSVAEARAVQRERQTERQPTFRELWPQAAREVARPQPEQMPIPQVERREPQQPKPAPRQAEPFPARRIQDESARKDAAPAIPPRTIEARPVKAPPGTLKVVDAATGLVATLGDFILDFLPGSSSPQRNTQPDMKAFVTDPAARKQQQLDRLAAAQQEKNERNALHRMAEDMAAGRNLKAEDIRSLTRQHQEQIRTFGDSAVRQMVDDSRKYGDRYWKGEERERER